MSAGATDQQLKIWWAEGIERDLVWKWEICERCHGWGTHANPAFDGMTTQSLYETYDDEEADLFIREYKTPGGMYSVKCEVGEACVGGRIWVPAEENLTQKETEDLEVFMLEAWECEAESEAERRAGC